MYAARPWTAKVLTAKVAPSTTIISVGNIVALLRAALLFPTTYNFEFRLSWVSVSGDRTANCGNGLSLVMYNLAEENHTTADAYNYGSADKGPAIKGYYNAVSRQQVFNTAEPSSLDRTAFNVFQFEESSGAICNVKVWYRSIPNPVIGRLLEIGNTHLQQNMIDDPELVLSDSESL